MQAFGVSQLAVETHMKGKGNAFIVQGDESALTRGQSEPPYLAAQAAPLQPPSATTQFHRLPLYSMVDPEVGVHEPNTFTQVITLTDRQLGSAFCMSSCNSAVRRIARGPWLHYAVINC